MIQEFSSRDTQLIRSSLLTRIDRCKDMIKLYKDDLERMDSGKYNFYLEEGETIDEVADKRRAATVNVIRIYTEELDYLKGMLERI